MKNIAPAITLSACAFYLCNLVATVNGAQHLWSLLQWPIPALLTTLLWVSVLLALMLAFVAKGLSGRSGTQLFILTLLLAPVGYHNWGLPWAAGLVLALTPGLLFFHVGPALDKLLRLKPDS